MQHIVLILETMLGFHGDTAPGTRLRLPGWGTTQLNTENEWEWIPAGRTTPPFAEPRVFITARTLMQLGRGRDDDETAPVPDTASVRSEDEEREDEFADTSGIH